MSDWKHPKNDGFDDVAYDFGVDDEAAARISRILNEACHVFRYHADGNWRSSYKDACARELADEFRAHPCLSGRILRSGDRVLKMLAHRALELNLAYEV